MNLESYFDRIPLLFIYGISVVVMAAGMELGFRVAKGQGEVLFKAQLAQVRSIMAAALGLFAFMLAFSFNIAQTHFEKRNEAFLMEINAISATYMAAGLLAVGEEESSKALLRRFVAERVTTEESVRANRMDEVARAIQNADVLLESLWRTAEEQDSEIESGSSGMLTQSVVTMVGTNQQRKHAALYNRISPVIWMTLLLVSTLSMLVTGYHAGLTGTRSRVATWTLALIFSAVLTLVTDLDRPRMTLFNLNQQQMVDLQRYMADE